MRELSKVDSKRCEKHWRWTHKKHESLNSPPPSPPQGAPGDQTGNLRWITPTNILMSTIHCLYISLTRTKTLPWLYIFKYWQNLMLYHGMTWKTHFYQVNVDTDWYLPGDSLLGLVMVESIGFGLRLYPRNSFDIFSTSVFTISTSRWYWWLHCSSSIFPVSVLCFRAQARLAEHASRSDLTWLLFHYTQMVEPVRSAYACGEGNFMIHQYGERTIGSVEHLQRAL